MPLCRDLAEVEEAVVQLIGFEPQVGGERLPVVGFGVRGEV